MNKILLFGNTFENLGNNMLNTDFFKLYDHPFTNSIEDDLPLLHLDDKVSLLSGEAEQAHQEVRKMVLDKTGIYLPKCGVFGVEMEEDGLTFNGTEIITVNKEIANLSEGGRFESFKALNAEATPKDYFMTIVAHEYGHQYFDRYLRKSIASLVDEILDGTGLNNEPFDGVSEKERMLKSINEGYATWFGQAITGMKTNFFETKVFYDRCLYSVILDIHDALQAKEDVRSAAFSLTNIARNYLRDRVQHGGVREDSRDYFAVTMRQTMKDLKDSEYNHYNELVCDKSSKGVIEISNLYDKLDVNK